MKRFSIILVSALVVFAAGCSKNIEPSSSNPDAWKTDVTLPVPIEFGSPAVSTRATRIESMNDATNLFGVFGVSKTCQDVSKNDSTRLLYNAKAKYNATDGFYLYEKAFYPMNSDLDFNFYAYYTRKNESTDELPGVHIANNRIYVTTPVGAFDILYGSTKVTPAMEETVTYGYNARYIRQLRNLFGESEEQIQAYSPHINFRHVTSSLQFYVKTDNPQTFRDENIWVSTITLNNVPVSANLCIVDLASDVYTEDEVMNEKEGTFEPVILGNLTTSPSATIFPTTTATKLGTEMFIVPQETPISGVVSLKNNSGKFSEVKFTLDPKKMKDSAGKVLGSFKPGHYYNMTLLVHSPEKITITVSIEDWKNGFNPDAEGSADDYVQDLDPLESEE